MDLTERVHCPNRFRHLTSSKGSATQWVRSVDPFERNFDRADRVVDCTREVVVPLGEVSRPFECGAPSRTERSATISTRSVVLIVGVARAIAEVDDLFEGRE
jgi:hypothetical protein